MKLTKGRKIALACFAVFLGSMAVCTVAAKGIYASGLPRVSTAKPYSGSLTHVIKVYGTVMQGQEYGIYVEPGLRVDTVNVGKGDSFRKEEALFRIVPGDLADIIAQRRLEISKLEAQLSEAVKEDRQDRQTRQQAAERAWEDYDREAALADAKIQECRQAYEAAQRALVLYNQYLEDAARSEGIGTESTLDGNGGDRPGENGAESSGEVEDGTPQTGENGAVSSGEAGVDTMQSEENGAEASGDAEDDTPQSGGNGAVPSGEAEENTSQSEGNGAEASGEVGVDTSQSEGNGAEASGEEDDTSQPGENGSVADPGMEIAGESGRNALHEVADGVPDPEDQYNKEEKRRQLEQNVIEAAQALAEAERQKEERLQTAFRAAEDAEAALETANAAVNILALEIAYLKERLQGLEELLAAEGWVYAKEPGSVTDSRLEVGERTQDRACLLYALDTGKRVISAVFDEKQAERVSPGMQFDMKATMSDGNRITGTALVDYVEKGTDGRCYARLSFDRPEISMGQSVELSCRIQTENYTVCVPANCIYEEGETDGFYVYAAEERQGVLGTEWKVRKVYVQILDRNDTAAAIQSMELTADSRIVTGASKPLSDGDTVRIVP